MTYSYANVGPTGEVGLGSDGSLDRHIVRFDGQTLYTTKCEATWALFVARLCAALRRDCQEEDR